ncbi:hypothetical protein ACFCZ2_02405 [Streptomyces sp. NPDC056202]|uniref:hypothetical protein n=1 Tax=Streptomyces sp. NPDC056202 TaxID=3345745 RepID=UPI0035E0BCC8
MRAAPRQDTPRGGQRDQRVRVLQPGPQPLPLLRRRLPHGQQLGHERRRIVLHGGPLP